MKRPGYAGGIVLSIDAKIPRCLQSIMLVFGVVGRDAADGRDRSAIAEVADPFRRGIFGSHEAVRWPTPASHYRYVKDRWLPRSSIIVAVPILPIIKLILLRSRTQCISPSRLK